MGDCLVETAVASRPDIRFYRLLASAPLPTRAGRDALGQLPIRAARYCDAAASASSFGWWLFPPMDFSLAWHGNRILWTWGGRDTWFFLDAAQFPGYAAVFDAAVPASLRGLSPPFLTALPEAGHVQIWTGYFARSAPGWSLLVRPPANMPPLDGCLTYEGLVESDAWFGPVFANLRLSQQDEPVHISSARPMMQIQPVRRTSYSDAALSAMAILPELDDLTPGDWTDYAKTICRRNETAAKTGSYAIAARRRRKAEVEPA